MKYLPYIALFIIVIFVNFDKETPIWDLFYYLQNYMYVGFFIYMVWILIKDVITRSLLIGIGLYYLFEFGMDLIHIFNSELYDKLYTTSLINTVLSISCAMSLFIYPFINKKRK